MRIIAGAFKGRRLAPVKGQIRPTAAKVREAVFSILGPAVLGAKVLDLFAGTGALGIEALSRGAAVAVFVEDHPESLRVLHRNLEALGLTDRTTVWPLPVTAALKKLAGRGERFGLAFLDPPYAGGDAAAALSALAELSLLLPGTRVVVEHSRREDLPEACGPLRRLEVRRYGDTQVAFYLVAEPARQEHD
ncbi:MAG: 16S rRNA (guanine(966)-N(2))-methyltransferase RsmD [Deltaproteobacteria bacterium CG07_land_8_20_14_0_80_60_11]|nr:MAG: 16S rRNA (guanine(966)-N(2))-methyltransferase RsmD [Deltaproteobacteria bacterium CG07_land_8_20_14_0_80_60_11]